MATFKNGPNGAFSGKVGSVVGSSWKGIDYIRGLPKKRTSPPTEDEAANRTKFGFTQKWLNHFAPFISIGYMNYSKTMTANNSAMSWNSKNAVKGDAPDFEINYSSVLLSDGPLQEATDPSISITSESEVLINWSTVYRRKAKATDELLFIAFCPNMGHSFFSLGDAIRSEDKYQLEIPEVFRGQQAEVFMAFCSRDRKIASRSQYLGNIILTP